MVGINEEAILMLRYSHKRSYVSKTTVGYCLVMLASLSLVGNREPRVFFILRAWQASAQQHSVMHTMLMAKISTKRMKFRVCESSTEVMFSIRVSSFSMNLSTGSGPNAVDSSTMRYC